ncbi:DUF6345 domain-containing protein [Amycolatopsis sp. NPDC059657]|uniref:DUF6345 domain-containing protein n=1 Tax=Amycolatopsis sp. NPDC059657 TaxID=3346899 RepID=UPI003672132F
MALLDSLEAANPLRATAAAAAGMYGFCSIETFAGTSGLRYTHEDAQGFHDYVAQFTTPNFWFKDQNVTPWVWDKNYDNYQDQFGFDASCVSYHSGHGDMDKNTGVYRAPMGAAWNGADWIYSDAMRLGDNNARYLFFSTCLSLRVHDGMTPVKTWHGANGGFRMLFGFETESIDDPNYGKYFWEEWNKNKAFSKAWMDASWRIDRNQAPSVMACGATDAEARNRLDNERQFDRTAATPSFYTWRWFDPEPRGARRSPNAELPDRLAVARLHPSAPVERGAVGERFGLSTRSASLDAHVSVGEHGFWEARLAHPAEPGADPGVRTVRLAAERAVDRYGLADAVDLVFDEVRYEHVASAGTDGTGTEAQVREAVVTFRQVINGIPVTSPGYGEVRIRVDSGGTVTSVSDTSRPVADLIERARADAGPDRESADGVESAVNEAVRRRVRSVTGEADDAETVPGSAEVGYDLSGSYGDVVASRTVRVDCGEGLVKRYRVQVPVTA